MLEYQNLKMLFQKVTLQVGLKKFLWLKELKILCVGHMLILTLMEKKLLKYFAKTNLKLGLEKPWREKEINYMLNGKVMIICLIVGSTNMA